MKITFLGHAALRIDADKKPATLVDPWFSKTGAFFRSWFQFPENSQLLDSATTGIGDILISHNHADHFDPPVLRAALAKNPNLKIHIAKFATDWFKNGIIKQIPEATDRLVVHAAFENFELSCGVLAFFVPEESPGQIDSTIVFKDGDEFFVNMNDSRLNTPQLEKIAARASKVNFVGLQASGASEYPINYLYDPADMEKRKLEKRQLKFEHCEHVADILQPERILFFAGPPVFLDPVLAPHNDLSQASVFPDQIDILCHFDKSRPDISERSYFLLPGEEFSDRFLWRTTAKDDPRLLPFTKKSEYIEEYRQRRTAELDFDLGKLPEQERLLAHFKSMANISAYVSAKIGGKLCFVIKSETDESTFTVDFDQRQASLGLSDDPLYILTAPARAVTAVLDGEATWDDVFLSIRMSFDERTERFISHFKTLLKYLDADMMEALEAYEEGLQNDGETVMADIVHDGKTHRIQRFCPHAGVDLVRQGKVNDDGTITCMAHRFCFDLTTGKCTNVEGFKLKVE
ncbi:MAG: nitrite reductase/ring-hydroxylating ferredoxin subunit [Planctomycetota bacterium]|jgi:nitrite reductase/ring-hydroxylating ferredoxin subunit